MCVKRALAKLRVAADWHAPIERNVYEARWLQVANAAVPGAAPAVLGQHERLGVLVMEYLSPAEHRLWKRELRDGNADVATARAVGSSLARIHAFTAARRELAAQFATDAIFFDIRLDPYLLATGRRHPDLAPRLAALVEQTRTHTLALVHGDVSPKNILVGPTGRCSSTPSARGGAIRRSTSRSASTICSSSASGRRRAATASSPASRRSRSAYLGVVDWEPRAALERRAAALLPGLLLARVDGKSPVEYLHDDAARDSVRRVARRFLVAPTDRLRIVAAGWRQELAP